jgi:hypothetical protein
MRNADSSYDTRTGSAIMDFLSAIEKAGHAVATYVNGNVEVDGEIWESDAFDRAAMAWDGTEEGLDQIIERHRRAGAA